MVHTLTGTTQKNVPATTYSRYPVFILLFGMLSVVRIMIFDQKKAFTAISSPPRVPPPHPPNLTTTMTQAPSAATNATECIRFGYLLTQRCCGVGHRFAEVVMGMTFAQEIGATFLYDPSIWNRKGSHGRYGWMVDFLPLQEIELTKGDQEFQDKRAIQNEMGLTTKTGSWENIVNYSKEENPCYAELGTVLHLCPAPEGKSGTIWCSEDPNRIGDFDAVKGRMREAYSRSKYSPSKQLPELLGINNTETFSFIVWHLRVGDIVLNNNKEYFSSLSKQIVSAFQNSGMVPLVVFLGEGGEEATGKSFPFLHDICDEFFSAKCFYPVIDVRDSLYYMIHADILVTSGSSFPAVAATLRTRGMTLSAGAKPKEIREIYETSEQLQIDLESGTVQNIDALKRYLQQQKDANN